MSIPSLIVVAVLLAGGVRSLAYWRGRGVEDSADDKRRLLYAVFVAGRVGLWFSAAGFVALLGLVPDPANYKWFVIVPGVFAAVQIFCAYRLGQGSPE